MFTTKKRVVAVLLVAALIGAILVSGVVAAQFLGFEDQEKLEAAMREDPVTRVADIGAAPGLAGRGVFVQMTSTGLLCIFDAPSATSLTRQGGCNGADDPLGGKKIFFSFAYDGGPAPADVTDARLIGLASPQVAAVAVLMSNGARRKMALRRASVGGAEYLAFGYRITKPDLRGGVTPTAVLALNEAGEEIDRQETGFAG